MGQYCPVRSATRLGDHDDTAPARANLAHAQGSRPHRAAGVRRQEGSPKTGEPDVKTPEIIERMRIAGQARGAGARRGRQARRARASPPTSSTGSATSSSCDHGAYPSTLGYRGYPKSLCTSINEVICHGIPDDTVLQRRRHRQHRHHRLHRRRARRHRRHLPGRRRGRGVPAAGRAHPRGDDRAIKAVAPGRQLNVIGRVIESYAKRFGYGVVRDFTGHGIGTSFHSGLIVPHYDDPAADGDSSRA